MHESDFISIFFQLFWREETHQSFEFFFEILLSILRYLCKHFKIKGPVLRRENYRGGPRRQPVSSRRDNYVSPRDYGYATKDR